MLPPAGSVALAEHVNVVPVVGLPAGEIVAVCEKIGAALITVTLVLAEPVPPCASVAVAVQSKTSLEDTITPPKSNVADVLVVDVFAYVAPVLWLEKTKDNVGLPPSISLALAEHVTVSSKEGLEGLMVTLDTTGAVFSSNTLAEDDAVAPWLSVTLAVHKMLSPGVTVTVLRFKVAPA
jgi:hypothetical protein